MALLSESLEKLQEENKVKVSSLSLSLSLTLALVPNPSPNPNPNPNPSPSPSPNASPNRNPNRNPIDVTFRSSHKAMRIQTLEAEIDMMGEIIQSQGGLIYSYGLAWSCMHACY